MLVVTRWAMSKMVLSETIIFTYVVTQEHVAVLAVPHCLMSLLSVVVAVVTALTIHFSSDRKVGLAKTTCGSEDDLVSYDWNSYQSAPWPGQPGNPSQTCKEGQCNAGRECSCWLSLDRTETKKCTCSTYGTLDVHGSTPCVQLLPSFCYNSIAGGHG